MAEIPLTPRDLHLILALPGTGKTTALRKLRQLPRVQVLDTDEVKVDTLKPILKTAKAVGMWSCHNLIWHSQIGAGVNTLMRANGWKSLLVFDHSGWFVKDLNWWPRVASVTSVVAPLELLARRYAKRENQAYDKAYSMIASSDQARESLLRYLPKGLKLRTVVVDEFNAKPESLVPPSCFGEATSLITGTEEVHNG